MPGNRKLGVFLRSRRSKLRPEEMGLVAERPRRTPGLLREEVARLAGISTEWYVRLEQGRTVSPSPGTIEALGAALRLSGIERSHLRSLARGGTRDAYVRELVPEVLQHVVQGLSQPAYVTGQRWDVLAWNQGAADLLTDFALLAVEDRNILLFMFSDPKARHLFGSGWAGEARRMVSMFRATHDLWPSDAAFGELVERLRSSCPEFGVWWADHEVAAPSSGAKMLHGAGEAAVRFEYATFQANDDPSLKLALYVERNELPEMGRSASAPRPL